MPLLELLKYRGRKGDDLLRHPSCASPDLVFLAHDVLRDRMTGVDAHEQGSHVTVAVRRRDRHRRHRPRPHHRQNLPAHRRDGHYQGRPVRPRRRELRPALRERRENSHPAAVLAASVGGRSDGVPQPRLRRSRLPGARRITRRSGDQQHPHVALRRARDAPARPDRRVADRVFLRDLTGFPGGSSRRRGLDVGDAGVVSVRRSPAD